jgi:hypothetical protein
MLESGSALIGLGKAIPLKPPSKKRIMARESCVQMTFEITVFEKILQSLKNLVAHSAEVASIYSSHFSDLNEAYFRNRVYARGYPAQ